MDTHESIHELIPAFALGALDPQEAELFTSHLAQCESCREEIASYQDLVGVLALAVPVRSAPPELKNRILSAAHPAQKSVHETHLQSQEKSEPARRSWTGFFQTVMPAWSVLSLLLIGMLAISNLRLTQRIESLEQSQPEFQTVNLRGTSSAAQAVGMLVISPDGQSGSLVVDRMPALADNQDYQLWLIKDGERTSGGVFHSYSNGYGVLWIHTDDPLISYTEVGITVEPSGGSPAPTGDKIIGGLIQ